jgi:Tol biopolymer transport system component
VTTLTNAFYNGRDSFSPQLSGDGRYLLFHSYAAYLTTNPLTSGDENLHLRDLQSGSNYALTTATTAAGVTAATMTPDGRFVAFGGRVENDDPQLYVWDTQALNRIYTNTASSIEAVSMSVDGNRIAYVSSASNALYVADRSLGTNWFVSAGKFWSPAAAGLRFSADARFLVYATMATNAPSDTNSTQDVYLYDCLGGTNLLVSRSCYTMQPANDHSDSPSISPDGRFIAFRSAADDVVPDDENGVPDLFLFDRVNQAMMLVTVDRAGNGAANHRSLSPVFSADSASLLFSTWASDLRGGDFNQVSDLLLLRLTMPPITDSDNDGMEDQWELDYFMTLDRDGTADLDLDGMLDATEFKTGTNPTNALSLFRAELEMVATPAPVPLVSWPAKPWGAYRVQFKDDPGDAEWQDLESPVTLFGQSGVASDVAPNAMHRFYRVVLVE